MVRTIVFLLLTAITLSVLATPFLAAVGALFLLLLFAAAFWWIGLVIATRGRPSEAVLHTRVHSFLGPGGPDDPFADVPHADVEEER